MWTVLRYVVAMSVAPNQILILHIFLTQYRKQIQKFQKKNPKTIMDAVFLASEGLEL